MARTPLRIEILGPEHDRSGFDCGVPALNKYILTSVDREVRNRLARCYVAVHDERAVGFYSLSNHAVDLGLLPKKHARKIPPGYLAPTILLGRLAVDVSMQGKGYGGLLLIDALRRSLSAAAISGAWAMVVYAKDDRAKKFYEHFGFLELKDSPSHVFLPLKTAEEMLS